MIKTETKSTFICLLNLQERMENRGEAPEVLTIDEQDNEIPVIDILD